MLKVKIIRTYTTIILLFLICLPIYSAKADFMCGDADDNGSLTVLDYFRMMGHIYFDSLAPVFENSDGIDNFAGTNSSDLEYFFKYLYWGGSAPECLDELGTVLPESNDTLFIINDSQYFGQTSHVIDLWFKPEIDNQNQYGFTLVLKYQSTLDDLVLDTVLFDGSVFSDYWQHIITDRENKTILIAAHGMIAPPILITEGHVATVYFSGFSVMEPGHHIKIDTTTYLRGNINIFSKGGYPFIPEIIGLDEIVISCGDINEDGYINILDITGYINYLYINPPPPFGPDLGDINNDGNINVLDISYLIRYIYQGGTEPNCP